MTDTNSQATTVVRKGAPWALILTSGLMAAKFTVAPTIPYWVAFLPLYPVLLVLGLMAVIAIGSLVVLAGAFIFGFLTELAQRRREPVNITPGARRF